MEKNRPRLIEVSPTSIFVSGSKFSVKRGLLKRNYEMREYFQRGLKKMTTEGI